MAPTGVLLLAASCGFEINATPSDGPTDGPIDTVDVIDTPTGPPASCKAVQTAMPSAPSGPYMIDSDGSGPDQPLSVTCDMTTAGGGWTLVFLASSDNLAGAPAYTSFTPRLLADASSVLVAYRSTAGAVLPNSATFAIPPAWRTTFPLNVPGTDVVELVSVDGAAPVSATVRFGTENFNNRCSDGWSPTTYGRFCISNTRAPYYNGFASTLPDNCGDSLGSWNSVACTTQRFSIAVR